MAKLSGKLSVLMPAYNEETIIYANALEAARQISPLADDYELLVIDDGSSDRTKAEIERAAAENPKIRCISPTRAKAVRCGKAQPTPGVTISPFAMPTWTLRPNSWRILSTACSGKMLMLSLAARCTRNLRSITRPSGACTAGVIIFCC